MANEVVRGYCILFFFLMMVWPKLLLKYSMRRPNREVYKILTGDKRPKS